MRRFATLLLPLSLIACASAQRPAPRRPWVARAGGPSLDQLLNVHRSFAPSVSADGQRVAFLSDASGLPQAWASAVGEAPTPETGWQRLVSATERVQWVRMNPDGQYVLTGRDVGGDENTQIFRAASDGSQLVNLTPPGVKTMFGALSADGALVAYVSNERSRADFDVYLRPVRDGEARRVLEATGSREAAAISRDGRRVAVVEERSNFDQDIVLVDAAAGTSRSLTAHPAGTDIRYVSPRFTPDGARLWVVSDNGQEFTGLALIGAEAPVQGPLQYVLREDHDIDAFETSPDGSRIAVVFNIDGYASLRVYDARDPAALRELQRPEVPRGVISTLSFSRDGASLVFDLSRATAPDEVFRLDVARGTVHQVTRSEHAGLREEDLVEPTLERVTSFDGTPVSMLVYRPRGLSADAQAPSVVWVHGGPEAQFTPYFSAVIQYLVGHGYVVAAPNVRGSTGYGKRFAHLDDVARREDSVRDLAAVNQWLRGQPGVSPERIAILGGSYGGYMVLAALTLQPELWAAGCDIVGIANFRTFLERTASYRRALREAEYGALARDGALLDQISPIHRVDRIRAPLFVIHGANDPRVPVQEAEQIVAALRARQHRVEYQRFENEGHGIARRENKVAAYGALVRFFDEVLGR